MPESVSRVMKQKCTWMATGELQCMSQGNQAQRAMQPEHFFQDAAQQQGTVSTKRTVVGREYFFFDSTTPTSTGTVASPTPCSTDDMCGMTQRCDGNIPQQGGGGTCVACAEVGCIAGKSCSSSSDCAVGLSCQAGVCTVGSVQTDDRGTSYNDQRDAYARLGSVLSTVDQRDCATTNTCGAGYPCDSSAIPSQCRIGLMCDGGICKSQLASACHYSSDCSPGLVCMDAKCVQPSVPVSGSLFNRGLDYLASQTSYF